MTINEMQEDIVFLIEPFGFILYKDWDCNTNRQYIYIDDLYDKCNLGISDFKDKKFFKTETAIKWIKKKVKEHIKELQKSLNKNII